MFEARLVEDLATGRLISQDESIFSLMDRGGLQAEAVRPLNDECSTIAGCDDVRAISHETMWLGEVCMCMPALVDGGIEYLHCSLTGL
jgi:hypothetical protein